MTILDDLNIATCAVSYGKESSFGGSGASVSIVVTPEAIGVKELRLIWDATGDIFTSFEDDSAAGAGVAGSIQLPQTGQDGFIIGGGAAFKDWFYRATVRAELNGQVKYRSYNFQIPAGTTSFDLDRIAENGAVTAGPAVGPVPVVTTVNGVTGAVVVEPAGLSDATKADLATTYGIVDPLEGVALYNYGDSYGDGSQGADQNSRPFNRLAKRHLTADITLRAQAGTRMDQVAQRILDTWTPNSRGLVGFSDGVINDVKQYGNDANRVTTCEAFRSCLAMLTAKALNTLASSAITFGYNWSAGVSSTAGSIANVKVTASAVNLMVGFHSGAGGTLTVHNGATLLKTVATGGYAQDFIGTIPITGLSGTTELRVTLVSGAGRIYGVAIPSAYAPPIVWDKPGRYSSSNTEATRLALYLTECATILADFPSVVPVDMGAGWDYTTMIAPDATHRNDLGNAYAADKIDTALKTFLNGAPRQGLNRLLLDNSNLGADVTYVAPTATPIIVITTYASDSFGRTASTPGVTDVGGLTWTQNNGSTTWSTNGTQLVSSSAAIAANDCYVDTGHADGTIQIRQVGVVNAGIMFRGSGTNNVNGYIFWSNSGTWTLSKRTALGSYTAIATGGASSGGAVMTVVLNGSSIICKINGTAVITVTDASYTGTRHGLWANNSNAPIFDDFLATDQV